MIAEAAGTMLGTVLIASLLAKTAARDNPAKALVSIGIHDHWAMFLGWGLLATEAIVGALLLTATQPWAGLAAVWLTGAYVAFVSYVLLSGTTVDCRCFGKLSSGATNAVHLIRAGLLLSLAIAVLLSNVETAPARGDFLTSIAGGAIVVVAFALLERAYVAWRFASLPAGHQALFGRDG